MVLSPVVSPPTVQNTVISITACQPGGGEMRVTHITSLISGATVIEQVRARGQIKYLNMKSDTTNNLELLNFIVVKYNLL